MSSVVELKSLVKGLNGASSGEVCVPMNFPMASLSLPFIFRFTNN